MLNQQRKTLNNEKIKIVETSEQIIGTQRGANEVNIMPDAKKNELANSVTEINKVAANYDMKRLANIVDFLNSKLDFINIIRILLI